MSRNVRKFSLPCMTSVTKLSLYLIITWRIKKSSTWRSYCSSEYLEFNLLGCNYQTTFLKTTLQENMLRGPRFVVFYRIVIETDHYLTITVQDYSIGSGTNILLHESDITSGLIVKNMLINHLNPPKPEHITSIPAKQDPSKPCGFMGYTTTLVKYIHGSLQRRL